ncbi:HD domain-containing phosphohydrolase [Agromyces sp. SYSU T00194]|uniref:HD domain-containing phosphohydrolase n=1 Tax=Agromyces chitinivorans TaxID=3158560 RepID=UPI003393FA06
MAGTGSGERVRTAEIVAALSLAIDYGMGRPLEQGMHSGVVAARLARALGVDPQTERAAWLTALLLHVTCTTDAHFSAEVMAPGATSAHIDPIIFGSPGEQFRGALHAVGVGHPNPLDRAAHTVSVMTRWARARPEHFTAMCEVGPMLSARFGLPSDVQEGLGMVTERWDGRGIPHRRAAEELPMSLRIAHLAVDAAFQSTLHPAHEVAAIMRSRAGGAFDPDVAGAFLADHLALLEESPDAFRLDVLEREPRPHLELGGAALDDALAAFGEFADLAAPCLAGHSGGVSRLAARAAALAGCGEADVARVRRAGSVHDVGGVTVWADIWTKPEPLSRDDREQVRLHPYHTQQVLAASPTLAALDPIASHHHEAMDGSGYHRGESGDAIHPLARILAAADAFRVRVEPRHGRPPIPPDLAAQELRDEAAAGRLDAECVSAVLEAAGEPVGDVPRPAGLSRREVQVVARLAHGHATKQIARELGIAVKTADRHVQNAYAKMGVSSRPAATLFAMQHGLLAWGELPIDEASARS